MTSKKAYTLLIYIPLLLLSVGCSLVPKKEKPKPKPITYSQDTLDTFKSIEEDQVIERYRQMRQENWDQRQIDREEEWSKKPRKVVRELRPAVRPKPAPKPAINRGDPEEIQTEISQIMDYYCIQHIKRYSSQSECKEFVDNVEIDCSSKFMAIDRKKVKCVKSALR
jgi:hypothetical protein